MRPSTRRRDDRSRSLRPENRFVRKPRVTRVPGTGQENRLGSVQVARSHLRIGPTWASTMVVTGFPPEAGMAWLEPLTSWPGVVDVAVHIDPIPAAAAASRVRRRRIRMESTRRLRADRGGLEDPVMEAVSQDASDLADQVARGESRLFHTTVVVTAYATTRRRLQADIESLRAHAASMLLDTHVMTWRQQQGWRSSLPIGTDDTGMRRIMDTAALATACPIAGPDLPAPLPADLFTGGSVLEASNLAEWAHSADLADPLDLPELSDVSDEFQAQQSHGPAQAGSPLPGAASFDLDAGGVLMGLNLVSGGVVTTDRWHLDNHNQVVLARSGAGKSYAVKVSILREMYNGVRVSVIDPEREYLELAWHTGGTIIELGGPGVQINPMALPVGDPDAFTRRCLFLHTLVDVMLAQALDPGQRAVLDEAVIVTYAAAGITRDPSTWARPAPQLRDLVATLDRLARRTAAAEPAGSVQADVARGSATGGRGTRTAVALEHGGSGGAAPAQDNDAAAVLVARLVPWITGSFSGLFDVPKADAGDLVDAGDASGLRSGRSSPPGQLEVWTTRLLAEELRPVGMLLAIDAIWRSVDRRAPQRRMRSRPSGGSGGSGGSDERVTGIGSLGPGHRQRHLVVVDEASLLLSEPAGARFLARLAKTSRKRLAGLTLITPDVVDLLGSELGEVILANAATVLLLRQAPQAIQKLARACALSPGEAQFLTTAGRGQGLLLAAARVPIDIIASPAEHIIASALPEELDGLHEVTGPWPGGRAHDPEDDPGDYSPADLAETSRRSSRFGAETPPVSSADSSPSSRSNSSENHIRAGEGAGRPRPGGLPSSERKHHD